MRRIGNKTKKNKTPQPKTFIDLRLVFIVMIIISIISTFITSFYLGNKNNLIVGIKTQALDCSGHGTNDDPQCIHENNPCGFSCTSEPKVVPSCCEDIRNTGDPFQCCFAARRVCRPDQCATIQGQKQRCGQMWELGYCKESPPQPTSPPPTSSQKKPRPFVGCVSAGEWLCQCELPNDQWYVECSILEDKEGKQKYIDRCAGDAEKARIQWLWDQGKMSGSGDPACCGGSNVCPLPTSTLRPIPPTLPPRIPPTDIPEIRIPTISPTSIPTSILPTTPPYRPPEIPVNNPEVQPSSQPLPTNIPTPAYTPTPTPKPILKEVIRNTATFVQKVKVSLIRFLSQILP